jgi:type IV pilus assembly protein PilO
MPRNFDLRTLVKDRRMVVRAGLGVLLAANLVMAGFLFHPFGGSVEDLTEEMRSKQRELALALLSVERTRGLEVKVQQAKVEGDKFLDECTMNRRSAFSTVLGEADKMAVDSGMKPKDSSYGLDPVEGSDTITQLTISANYEGSYASLTKFVNLLDKSSRFLIIESLQAAPQANGSLSVTLKLDTFIREAPGGKS